MTSASETQQLLSQSVEQLLSQHHSVQWLCEGKAGADLWPHLVELGLCAAELPEGSGGMGLPFGDLAPSFQKIGRALATTYLIEFAVMGGWLAQATGKNELAAEAAAGTARIALAFSEFGDGGDPAFISTMATPSESGWKLNGKKTVIVGGDRASHFIIPAKIGETDDNRDIGLFLVSASAGGLTHHSFKLYDGSGATDIDLKNVEVEAGAFLVSGAEAEDQLALALDRGRAALCHEIVGLLEVVQETTLDYVKTRKQFDQPIGAFQTMQHRMADMYMELELARSCAQLATDAVIPQTERAAREQTVSAAMAAICESARRVGQSAVQAHGGIALTQEYQVGHYFKRLTMAERYLGNADFHFERYIASPVA